MAVNVRDFHVTGNLVDDPKTITTNAGKDMTVFDLAENTRVREGEQWVDGETNYYSVGVSNERLGRNVESSLRKGDRVKVEGTLSSSPFVRNNGEAGINHRVFADDVAPSLRWHTAEPQADGQNANRTAGAVQGQQSPSTQAQGAGADEYAGWTAAAPGSGGLSR
ncbi:single-stranded DNA-binding protein [Kocuria coralli]|uniref:Single-stranded DNA-binding protein n=1 Tax=Kocuria coralli TaxID=1461025 RepID=A0A5J5KXD9_9MICC|nr:single-stranded DNA-binding protein [Kocuria coralli]KAA9394172.1 single-stranded DNA-binding protein [Kocuria coralli]